MKRSRFTEEQIIAVLREQEAGVSTAEVCRKHGVSSATFYKWKSKFGGLEVSEAKRLRALEDENGRLKRMLADAMLDNAALSGGGSAIAVYMYCCGGKAMPSTRSGYSGSTARSD
jgi:putative transposase